MITDFINYLKCIRGYSANTCKAYENDIRQFAGWMKSTRNEARWSTITREDIDDYIKAQYERGMKPATTNRYIAAISSLYNYMQRQGMDIDNPCKFESRRKLPEAIPHTIPVKDIRRAYDHAKGAAKLMIGILATTGIRLQEMLDLTWQDVDFDNNSLRISGKGAKERIVYTDGQVLRQLDDIRAYAKPTQKMFWIQQRTARYMIYEALRPYTRAEKCSPHILRHTFATELAKDGMSATTIGKMLGHKRLDTTQKYINLAEISTGQTNCCRTMFN